MNWTPSEDDIEWTKNILDSLEMNQDWMEGEMAFRRTGENTLTLLTRTERAESAVDRVKQVLDILEWEVADEDAKIIPDDPMAAAEAMQREAESWACPDCDDVRVVDMPLEVAMWDIKGETQYVDEEGASQTHDRWVVGVGCGCGSEVYLSPDDYYLVAGDINFYTWHVHVDDALYCLRVMPPEQIVDCVDSGIMEQISAFHLGTTFQGNTVPPHMRGTFCLMVEADPAGEEE
tara:strand:+ start:576 stop:1274 length:699 start_codon:yes stop_codon:yes gene_type:complete